MKKILILLFLMVGIGINAQKKNAKYIVEVDGVCGMCKQRIEKVCINTKGVKFANWDVNTHKLTLILNERRTSIKTVSQSLANAGHDTELVKASEKAYNGLHGCCKYREDVPYTKL